MRVKIPILLYCLILVISCSRKHQDNIEQQEEIVGAPMSIVVTPENADPIELRAASEFSKYTRLIFTSIPSELMVYIGNFGSSINYSDQVHYHSTGNKLYIYGGSPQSTLYSVYTFLENEWGCKFLTPDVEIIPKQGTYEMKEYYFDYIPEITTRTVHSNLFYEYPSFANKHKVTDLAFPGYVPKARVHTFHHFLPAESFYDNHPEYYALHNGKRKTTQLCLTNESVFNIVKDSVSHYLAESPLSTVISVSQDDNTLYCQCDKCEAIHDREGSASGTMIYFVNKIARAFPEKTISTLAYQYTRKAPKKLIPESNVLITLCSIECDRSAPIAENCQDFASDLVEWGKITNNIRIWDYTTQFTNFLAPFPNIHTLHPNIQLFKDNNAKWVFEQHSRNPSELFELRSYLTAKLLWEPNANPDSIKHDFLTHYYQEAAPFIESYIEDIHLALSKDSSFFLFLYGDPSQGFNSFLDKKNLDHYNSLYDLAEKAVASDQVLLSRVKTARLSIDYASLEYAKRNLRHILSASSFNIEEKLSNFDKVASHGNITMMNEMGYAVNEYISQYNLTLARTRKNNIAYKSPVTLLTQPKKYANEDPQTLTDGAYGGNSFFANWLGFEGNHLEAIIDLGQDKTITEISSAFLQVTNHIVFFPVEVEYLISSDNINFRSLGKIKTKDTLNKNSKVNDIAYYHYAGDPTNLRYLKIKATNINRAPDWHNAAGSPSWIFADEVEMR